MYIFFSISQIYYAALFVAVAVPALVQGTLSKLHEFCSRWSTEIRYSKPYGSIPVSGKPVSFNNLYTQLQTSSTIDAID